MAPHSDLGLAKRQRHQTIGLTRQDIPGLRIAQNPDSPSTKNDIARPTTSQPASHVDRFEIRRTQH